MNMDSLPNSITRSLRVGVVSARRATLEQIETQLRAWDPSAVLVVAAGGLEQVGRMAEREQLDAVLAEGTRHDIEELSALEKITARHPGLVFILLSPNHDPEFLRHGMRIGVRELLPTPVSKEALFEALGRVQHRLNLVSGTRKQGKVLTFVGCKGGSGTTFLGANLAYAISTQREKKVAIIDLSRQLGDASLYVSDRKPTATLADVLREVHRLDESLLASSMVQVTPTLSVLPGADDPEHGLSMEPDHVDALLWTATRLYDVVVVDAGTSLDSVTLKAMDQADTVFPVTQLALPFLRGAQRLLQALKSLGYPKDKLKLLVNRYIKASPITLEDLTRALRQEPFKTIPNSFATVSESVNQGVPIVQLAPRNPVSKALKEVAEVLLPQVAVPPRPGFFGGLLAIANRT